MISRAGTTSLSNMPVKTTKPCPTGLFDGSDVLPAKAFDSFSKPEGENQWEIIEFEETPKMSTYLVAYANGNFAYIEDKVTSNSGKEIPLRFYGNKNSIQHTKFALNITKKVLPLYEEMFQVEYPLPKVDTLVVHAFDAGAMENWGLIMGRTSGYLYNEESGGLTASKWVLEMTSHELAHQWFGNIVTMEWWDNLWLNEAFATFVGECVMVDRLEPEWNIFSEFVNGHHKSALLLDSLRSSHPIEQPCEDPNMIQQIFDDVSYAKGGAVLRMLASVIGIEKFLKGVAIYLKSRLYANSTTKDLWEGISQACDLDVVNFMQNWVLKQGFPVITVEEQDNGLKLRQGRFLSTGDPTPEEDSTIWQVPILLKHQDKDGKPILDRESTLSTREAVIPLPDVKNTIFKLNNDTAGVYRVVYSAERLEKLGKEALKEGSMFSIADRIGLVQDAFYTAVAGYGRTSGTLSLFQQFSDEKEDVIWSEIAQSLSEFSSVWWEEPKPIRNALDGFRVSLFGPLVKKYGFDSQPDDPKALRELRIVAIAGAAAAGDSHTLHEIKRRFAPVIKNGDESLIPADVRGRIFRYAVRYGGKNEFDTMKKIFDKPPTSQHREEALSALGQTEDSESLEKFFDMISDPASVSDNELQIGTGPTVLNITARRPMWKWMKDNYDSINKRLGATWSIGFIIRDCVRGFTAESDAQEVEAFFEDKDTSMYKKSLDQALDTIRARAAWLKRDAGDVEEWLKHHGFLDAKIGDKDLHLE